MFQLSPSIANDTVSEHSDKTGEQLIVEGLISRDQLQIALHEQKQSGEMLGGVLVRLGFLSEDSLADRLAARVGLKPINLKQTKLDPALLKQLPKEVAERCHAVLLHLHENTLEVAMADPYNVLAIDEIRRHFPPHYDLSPRVASAADIADAIQHHYGLAPSLGDILQEIETGSSKEFVTENAYEHPIVRMANQILFEAVRQGASDIHLEPESSFVRLRYRIDGGLRQMRALHQTHWAALSNRIKIMAGMNIAATRIIQDGRFQLSIDGYTIDFRVAVMPTVWGENIVIRVLDHRRALVPLEQLGFDNLAISQLHKIMARPQGITLITGPTGSGKTTTLYSILQQLNTVDVKIATLEEPVEYQLDLIRQTSVQETQGLSFAAGVRGVLRMDPNIVFIGEVRDPDTAQMALRAAMSGHQIYTTLHCTDVFGAIPRLIDLGQNPRVLAGNINGIIAQRLVRKLCVHCKSERHATSDERNLLLCHDSNASVVFDAQGCALCNHSGKQGRTVIAEILPMTSALDECVAADFGRSALLKQAQSQGFRSMQQDGVAKVVSGMIDLGDLCRAVDMTRGH